MSYSGFLFANLVDSDQLYGHRNDVAGFYGALRLFDAALPGIPAGLRDGGLTVLTADHGNDPTTQSTDHAGGRVPVLMTGEADPTDLLGPWRDDRGVVRDGLQVAWHLVSWRDTGLTTARDVGPLGLAALSAMRQAYAPYSHFRVGAALLASDGSVSVGCNMENAASPAGLCAERGALAAAVAGGHRSFDRLVVATEAAEPTPPCGLCRQALVEFAVGLHVVAITTGGGRAEWALGDLLPQPFTPASLTTS